MGCFADKCNIGMFYVALYRWRLLRNELNVAIQNYRKVSTINTTQIQ